MCYLLVAGVLAGLIWVYPYAMPLWAGALALAGYALVVCIRTIAVLTGLLLHDLEHGDPRGDESGGAWPVFTVLLPVYREAGMLPGLVQALADQIGDGRSLEIFFELQAKMRHGHVRHDRQLLQCNAVP